MSGEHEARISVVEVRLEELKEDVETNMSVIKSIDQRLARMEKLGYAVATIFSLSQIAPDFLIRMVTLFSGGA